MSRSNKGSKPIGWDYWGRRKIGWGSSGTKNKRLGISSERSQHRQDLQRVINAALSIVHPESKVVCAIRHAEGMACSCGYLNTKGMKSAGT